MNETELRQAMDRYPFYTDHFCRSHCLRRKRKETVPTPNIQDALARDTGG